ncbi:MAG: L,D-transpeptidase family protein [Pseudomonadota bacterium]
MTTRDKKLRSYRVNEQPNFNAGRRHALRALASGASVVAAAPALAGGRQWWEEVLDSGRPQRRASRSDRPQRLESVDDLRRGKTPFRSDVMLDAYDQAIRRYEAIARKRDWPRIAKGKLLRVGDYDERVPLLRRRLYLGGELSERAYRHFSSDHEYDDWLNAAVKKFQRSHGLRVTGMINRATLAQLNVSAAQRAQQLMLNRRRVEALMRNRVEDRYVLVNAAGFQLEAVEKYEVAHRHRVIVGKPDRQTPEIQAEIRGLNFFPFWRVPMSVARKDLFPRLIKEPEYLEENHIKVVKGHYNGPEIDPDTVDWATADARKIKFKQDPGPWNALGLVRINMPNPDIVYLHDTPMKQLFGARGRAFSAGCVRVQDVMRLVAWIAKYEPGWDAPDDHIESILAAGQAADFKLTRPIPVYFTYITAWAERDGTVEFRPDIYGRDGSADYRGELDPDEPAAPVMLSP